MSLHDLINQIFPALTFPALTGSLESRCYQPRRLDYQVSEISLREAHRLVTSLQDFHQRSPIALG